ncbi:MAG: hypothetical protein ACRC37_00410, partial [Lentisphaeria bacterium]
MAESGWDFFLNFSFLIFAKKLAFGVKFSPTKWVLYASLKGKFVGIFVILLGAVLGVCFWGNSSGKIAKNSDCLEFGENPGKNFSENEFFWGKTAEVFPKNAKTARFANLVSAKSGRFDDDVAAKIAVILDKDLPTSVGLVRFAGFIVFWFFLFFVRFGSSFCFSGCVLG